MKLLLLFLLISTSTNSQSIWSNPITGTNPSSSNPYTLGQTTDPNITVSGIGRGSGINASSANDRYSASNWNSSSLNPDDYFYFTLQPTTGYKIHFSNFSYTAQASGTGPVQFSLRSSLDNFTSELGTVTGTGSTVSLSTLQNVLGPVTFRFYAWGASASTGTFSLNSFSFEGAVVLAGPLPVRFSNVKAIARENDVEILFTNETEENVDQYFLEHSVDGLVFKPLKAQAPKKNSGGVASYNFLHTKPSTVNFYRIRALEMDKVESFSSVIKVAFLEKGFIRVYPNPGSGRLTFEVTNLEAGNYKIEIFNSLGLKVAERSMGHGGGRLHEFLDFKGFQRGIYWVRLGSRSLQVAVF